MKFMIVDDSAFSIMMIRNIYGDSIFISHVCLESMTASIATEFGEATLNVGFAGRGR